MPDLDYMITDLLDPDGRVDDLPNVPLPFPGRGDDLGPPAQSLPPGQSPTTGPSDGIPGYSRWDPNAGKPDYTRSNLGGNSGNSDYMNSDQAISQASLSRGTSSASLSTAAPPGKWAFPSKVPAPGENRILKPLPASYKNEDAKNLALPPEKQDKARVKYVSGRDKERYQIEIGARLKRRKKIFDTKEIKTHFLQKKQGNVGQATLGKSLNSNKQFVYPQDWAEGALIWICLPNEQDRPTIYSHVGKVHRFHHSSLSTGGAVIGAGEWIVRDGRLLKVSANSGHYRPTMDMLYHAVLHMAGAFNESTTVFLYDTVLDDWINYPVKDFISKPSNGGRYWVHPQSPLI